MNYCDAKVKVGHEEFPCHRFPHDEEDLHEWIGGVWPPCKECWGLDMHDSTCSQADVLIRGVAARVEWRTDEKPKVGRRR